MTRSSSTSARAQIVTIDDEVEICRDERCPKIGIHAKHQEPFNRPGPKPKLCPTCKEPLHRSHTDGARTRRCEICGFTA